MEHNNAAAMPSACLTRSAMARAGRAAPEGGPMTNGCVAGGQNPPFGSLGLEDPIVDAIESWFNGGLMVLSW